ncbi:MAG TPA: SiaB family protein kinase [Bacteroidia bacterium]|nr:SiaB family protein kinase [Bacteroidia bacterium]
MAPHSNIDAEFFDQYFSKKLDHVKSVGQLLLAYDGVLNSETISKLESEIEGKILDKNLPKMVVKKVFFISIESLQNMFIHGFRDENGAKHNFFILYLAANEVKIITANLIANTAIEKLTRHISKINSFDNPADLKTYYLEHLETNELSDKGGAGLGFITIGMKSGNKLVFGFEKINDQRSLFMMEVTIKLD